MPGDIGKCLGQDDLIVVGAGPVGIAALWYAGRHGLRARGLEAGSHPLASIHAYLPGLVTASTAFDWEIDGLPVDCRAFDEVTRDDLLGYYGRVVRAGNLRIALRQRAVGLEPQEDSVLVVVENPSGERAHWIAGRVIVTPWFTQRRLDVEGPGVTVYQSLADGPWPPGGDIVVVGGGLSGLEAADSLIRAGSCVTVLCRGSDAIPGDVGAVLAASGSRVLGGVRAITVTGPSTLQVDGAAGTVEIPCSALINCSGLEMSGAMLRTLRRAALLTEAERDALEPFRRAGVLRRLDNEALAAKALELPNLSDALWTGRRGVHFAGSLFHVGGILGAGIVYAIETARWAAGAVAGAAPPADAPPLGEHLPSWFIRQWLRSGERPGFPKRGPRFGPTFERIRPFPVPTWSRGTRVFGGEGQTGRSSREVSRDSRALGAARDEALTEVRSACYEGLSVRDLEARLGLEREDLMWALSTLWYNNGLTWLPPAP